MVEAGIQSGTHITANYALEQGREVFAVPGPIDLPGSVGPHRWIQQGAKLIREASDILEELTGYSAGMSGHGVASRGAPLGGPGDCACKP